MKNPPESAFLPQDQYEKDLMDAIEQDEFVPVENMNEEIDRYKSYFRNTRKKDKRITIRISQQDLEQIQERANNTQIPYQTLISSILHQYATGRIKASF
jgi:predicted DNA binding CopG/RHH family protein